MKFTLLKALVAFTALTTVVLAQTTSECNPMKQKSCPKDPALGGNYEHTYGQAAPHFTTSSSPEMILYMDDGAHFRVQKSGDAPTITSDFYIMYGKVSCNLRAAPGAGIVSSLVLLSDVLDEIDWEFIGSDTGQAQSNYFGKGNTETYDRVQYHPVDIREFHDYGVEWTPDLVKWSIDGTVVRTLNRTSITDHNRNFYPQTPMQVKIGPWSGGDTKNEKGVIKWAQGPTDYSKGPFDMIIKSITIQDYSTGSYYYYSDNSGSDTSIRSEGGKIMVGPSDDPPNIQSNIPVQPTNTPIPIATPRAPSNSGLISSTTTSTRPTTSACGTKQEETTNNIKTAPLPTTTTYLSFLPTGSSNFTYGGTSEPAGAGDATGSLKTSAPSGTSYPLEIDGAGMDTFGMRFSIPVIMAIAGVVGMGLVL